MNSDELYLQTKPRTLFMTAAIPGAISMVASSLYSVFDSMFVGKFLGTTAFAALGLAMPVIVINFALADLVGVGSSVPISIFLGKGRKKDASSYFTFACLLIVVTGLLSGAAIYAGAPMLMRVMGAEGELLELSVRYARIYALFSPLTTVNFALDNYLRICGRINTSMFLNIFSSAFTIALELLFIVVLGWGIEGAALGANVAMLAVVLFGVGFFLRGKESLRFVRPRPSLAMLGQIYKNGISTFLTNIAGRVFSIVMNVMLLRFGGQDAVAVYGVVMTITAIIEQVLYGMVDSMQPSIGFNYGAGRVDRVKALEKYVLIAGAAISCTGFAVMALVPAQVSAPFLEDLSLLGTAVQAVRITSLTYVVRWVFVVIMGLFMALERPYPAMAISVCSASVFPFAVLVALLPLGLTSLWWNYTVSAVLTTVLALALFRWLKSDLFAEVG